MKLALIGGFLLGTTLLASSPVTLKITPRVGTIPHTVNIKVIVEPDPDNRILWLIWGKAGEDMVSRSRRDLDGADAPRTQFFPAKILRESGEWIFVAQVEKVTGKMVQSAKETVEVVGGF